MSRHHPRHIPRDLDSLAREIITRLDLVLGDEDLDVHDLDLDDVADVLGLDIDSLYDLLDDLGLDEDELFGAIDAAIDVEPGPVFGVPPASAGFPPAYPGRLAAGVPASSGPPAAGFSDPSAEASANALRQLFGRRPPGNPIAIDQAHVALAISERLNHATLAQLRAIARSLGWSLRGQKRAEIMEQVAAAYRDPDKIAGALARLSTRERGLVAAAAWGGFVAGGDGLVPVVERLAPAVLGTSMPKPALRNELAELHERGYLLLPLNVRGPAMYVLPDWYPGLLPLELLTPPATAPIPASLRPAGDPLGTCLKLLLAMPAIGAVDPASVAPEDPLPARQGAWPLPLGSSPTPGGKPADLVPIPSFGSGLPAPVAHALDALLGAEEGEFFFKLAQVLGLVELAPAPRRGAVPQSPGSPRSSAPSSASAAARASSLVWATVPEAKLQAWLALAPAQQIAAFINGWLDLPYLLWTELDCLQRRGARFEVLRRQRVWNFSPEAYSVSLHNRRQHCLLWLRRLPPPAREGEPGGWVAARPALRWLYDAAPEIWVPSLHVGPWGLRDDKGELLVPGSETAWTLVAWPCFKLIIEGPLTWLGLVDTARGGDGELAALRLTALGAALLADRPPPAGAIPAIRQAPDGTLSAPITGAAAPLLGLLARHFRLRGVEDGDATWEIDAARVVRDLTRGATPETIAQAYHDLGWELPDEPRAAIGAIAARWGLVNLYQDLAVITFADAPTAREVALRTPLAARQVYQVSDTCFLVAAADAPDLVAAIQAAGHTPKVVSGAGA